MEHGGKGTEGIGAWGGNLTHDVDTDGAGLTYRETDLRALIAGTERLLDAGIGLRHRQSANMNRTIASDLNGAVGRHLQLL